MIDVKRPILSILIPTYNRADSFEVTLNSIAVASKALDNNQLEIIVGDNSSVDLVDSIVMKFAEFNPNIRVEFIKNAKNLGYDRNILNLMLKSSGQYSWFIGDRLDLVTQLASLIDCLKIKQPGFIAFSNLLLKNGVRCATEEVVVSLNFEKGLNFLSIAENAFHNSSYSVLDASISSRIFKMSQQLKELAPDLERYIGTQFMHVPIFYESKRLTNSNQIVLTREIYLTNRTILRALRFDAVAMTLGWRTICQDYGLPSESEDSKILDFFFNSGLKEFRLGLGSVGIRNFSDFSHALELLNITMPRKYFLKAVLISYCPKFLLRIWFILISISKRRIPLSITKIKDAFTKMSDFDREIATFTLDSEKI